MEKIKAGVTYLVNGKHKVLGLHWDITQVNTMHEYVVVWENASTGSIQVARSDSYGRAFGQGVILTPMEYVSYEGYGDGW